MVGGGGLSGLAGGEGDVLVDFRDRDRDSDLGHAQDGAVRQDDGAPDFAGFGTFWDGQAGAGRVQDDVAADRRHGGVFPDLDDAVDPAGAGTQDLENGDGVGDQVVLVVAFGAGDEGVRVTNGLADGLDAGVGAQRITGTPTQARLEGG